MLDGVFLFLLQLKPGTAVCLQMLEYKDTKKGHRKTSPVQTRNRTVLSQLKNVYVHVSLMKETGLTEVETGVFSPGID